MVGREANVKRAELLLEQLDSSGYGSDVINYDVKYSDPRALREALVANIPGLRASLAPASAGQPDVFVDGQIRQQGNDFTNTLNTAQGAAQGQGQGQQQAQQQQQQGATQQTKTSDTDLESPFTMHERSSVPMRLLLRGTKEQIEQAMSLLSKLDVAPKQIALELRVMELTKEDTLKAGIDWNILGGGAVKFVRLNNSQANPANAIGGNINGKKVSGDVTASLDAIANKTNLIARPNIFGQDGRQGEFFVGDVVRYVQSITNSQNGPTIVTGEVPVGVRLSFLPRVGADGNITLELRPRVSVLRGFTDVPGGGQLPQTSSRFSNSTFTMASGETIAIGGLIQDQDTITSSGLPILKDIPILGQLFRKSTTTRTRTEIVFFLTAKSIDGVVSKDQKTLVEEAGKYLPQKQGGKK
jgi:type II secretory pathway component GspD/PulD (secretin)